MHRRNLLVVKPGTWNHEPATVPWSNTVRHRIIEKEKENKQMMIAKGFCICTESTLARQHGIGHIT